MSVQYVGTNAGDTLAPHDLLRVTFAEEPHWFVPDEVASKNLAAEVANLVGAIESGGYALVPASDVNVPPGALAWTVDFLPTGSVSVGVAVSQLDAGLRTAILSNGYVARVEKVTGAMAGGPGAGTTRGGVSLDWQTQLEESEIGKVLAKFFGKAIIGVAVIGGITLLVVFAPEIKAALAPLRRVGAGRAKP